MRTIKDSKEFRENIVKKIDIIVDNNNISTNLEKGVFNFCIKKAAFKFPN